LGHLALTPVLLKLWDKGVDIAAGVITSTLSAGVIAVIATITWSWKRNRDLRFEAEKQRQAYSIAKEFDNQTKLIDDLQLGHKHKTELGHLIAAIEVAFNSEDREQLWLNWQLLTGWIHINKFPHSPLSLNVLRHDTRINDLRTDRPTEMSKSKDVILSDIRALNGLIETS
jgi:hypothetical protein